MRDLSVMPVCKRKNCTFGVTSTVNYIALPNCSMRIDGQTDMKVNSRFSQFCERA
jgi:hypothetical protein